MNYWVWTGQWSGPFGLATVLEHLRALRAMVAQVDVYRQDDGGKLVWVGMGVGR